MKISRFFSFLFAVLVMASGTYSCEDVDPVPGNGGDQTEEETGSLTHINGTDIDSKNTIIGLISDTVTGKGIPGVPVTDGYTYTVTDKNGVYQMVANPQCRNVYYTTPAQYAINSNNGIAAFYSTKSFDPKKVSRHDFKLTPLAAPEKKFGLFMIGDPQCQVKKEVDRYKTETIVDVRKTADESLAAGMENVYAVTLGDVTFDNTSLWGDMKSSMSNIKLTNGQNMVFFNCIGNHDHNATKQNDYDSKANYVSTFGPSDYSFNRGNAHVVVMDNIICTSTKSSSAPDKATWNYVGGLTDEQYEWLKQDLSHISDKNNTVVIFCAHIPFRGGSNESGSSVSTKRHYADVLNLLKQFGEAHVMIGHTHYSQNYIHNSYVCGKGKPIYEHVHGAACGSWWASNSDVIGGPNGYNVYTVEDGSIVDWYNKGTNLEKDFQLRVYDGSQEYSGTAGYKYTWYNGGTGGSKNIVAAGKSFLKDCFVAQVWDDDDSNWTVELYQGGVKVGDFVRLPNKSITNICYTAYTFNELKKNTDTWTSVTASHYWYYKPDKKPLYYENWEVRATQTIPTSGKKNIYTCNM